MKHLISLSGYGCNLRPVLAEDAQVIVDLRRSPFAVPFLGETSPDVQQQQKWLAGYFEREGDYYWMIEDAGQGGLAVGTFSLYDIKGSVGTVGRWVQSPSATFPSVAPTLLVYGFAFERLGLEKLVFNVVATNKKVLRFHRMLGERETHVEKDAQTINGTSVDFVWFEVTKEDWPKMFEKWDRLIK